MERPDMDHFRDLILIAGDFNDSAKKRWLREGQALLQAVAEDLRLSPGTYSIRTCAGGPAIPGEVVLHHDAFYVCLGFDGPPNLGFVRTVQSQQDYVGGVNMWVNGDWTYQKFLQLCEEQRTLGAAWKV